MNVKMKQKEVFLDGEGDAWFERNHDAIQRREFDQDAVVRAIARCFSTSCLSDPRQTKLLEIGCSDGKRLKYLSRNMGLTCYGIEPSAMAVALAQKDGLAVIQGTADSLPYENQTFDLVVFGFCLYLCDREDLFCIAQEADRVLKSTGWLVIQDFYSNTPTSNEYHHRSGLFAYKLDYRRLFDWHPDYTCMSHEVIAHGLDEFTDNRNEWVATSVLRKKSGHE